MNLIRGKRLLTLILGTVLLGLPSKELMAQFQWSPRIGINAASVHAYTKNKENLDRDPNYLFTFGVSADIPIYKRFHLQPALMYAGKGYKDKEGLGGTFTAKVDYIDLPLHLLYKSPLGSGNMIVGVGPYFSFGLGGKWKSEKGILLDDILVGEKGDILLKEDGYVVESMPQYLYGKPFDYGGSFVLGYDVLKTYSIQFHAQFGMEEHKSDWSYFHPDEYKKNRTFGITFGYKF